MKDLRVLLNFQEVSSGREGTFELGGGPSRATNNLDAKYFREFIRDLIRLTNSGKSIYLRLNGLGPVGAPLVSFLIISAEF